MENLETLVADIEWLVEFEKENPDFLYTPLHEYIVVWLTLNDNEKVAALPMLRSMLVDGQDCDHMDTPWEKEWLEDGKVCHCIACAAARKCISDIKLMEGNGKCSSHLI